VSNFGFVSVGPERIRDELRVFIHTLGFVMWWKNEFSDHYLEDYIYKDICDYKMDCYWMILK